VYIDIHCHLLPGVDDGVKTWEESLECLRLAVREKVSRVLVTPHIWPGQYDNPPAELEEKFEEWRRKASLLGLDLHLGSEVYYLPDLVEAHRAGRFVTMAGKGRHLLVELPLALFPPGVSRTLFELRLAGLEPILAHPERYPYAAKDPFRLEELGKAGVPFQITTHSVVGLFGAAIQKTAFSLLEKGWVYLMASDAHSAKGRPPLFREAVRTVANRYGKEAARRLCIENPRRVIEGRPLLPVRCRPARRWRGGRGTGG
jgi:protein-tyrosine phosphatase